MNSKCKSCGSCGMPMKKSEDFALGNMEQDYCSYCTDKEGKLFAFDKILNMNAKYYIESQGVTQEAALKMATDLLKNQPAWKNAR